MDDVRLNNWKLSQLICCILASNIKKVSDTKFIQSRSRDMRREKSGLFGNNLSSVAFNVFKFMFLKVRIPEAE